MPNNRDLVAQQYLSVLGRQAQGHEMDYLQKFLDSGELSGAEIGQFLQSLPEFQHGQLTRDTAAYGAELDKGTGPVLDQAAARINSQFAGQGRPVSSAQGGALAQVAQNLAMQKQSALAQFYGNGLNTNRSAMMGQGQDALGRAYGQRRATQQRQWDIEDYYRQQNDQNAYENARGGWNAITPQFALGSVLSLGGSALQGYASGKGMRAGLGK